MGGKGGSTPTNPRRTGRGFSKVPLRKIRSTTPNKDWKKYPSKESHCRKTDAQRMSLNAEGPKQRPPPDWKNTRGTMGPIAGGPGRRPRPMGKRKPQEGPKSVPEGRGGRGSGHKTTARTVQSAQSVRSGRRLAPRFHPVSAPGCSGSGLPHCPAD